MVRLLQLALLLQGFLLNLRICWIWYRAVSVETFMANNRVPLLGSTGTLWRPSITINSVPMLWQSVRWQLQQLAADLVRYWVLRVLQLAVLLQDFLLKLNFRLPFCRSSLSETSMVPNCVLLLRTTRKPWRPSIAIDSLPGLQGSAWWRLQRFIADLVRCLVIRHMQLALRRQDLLFKLEIGLSQCRAISMGTRKSNNCVLLLSPTRALRQPTITIDRMPVLRCSVRLPIAAFGCWPRALLGRGALAAGLAAAGSPAEAQHLLAALLNCPVGDVRDLLAPKKVQ